MGIQANDNSYSWKQGTRLVVTSLCKCQQRFLQGTESLKKRLTSNNNFTLTDGNKPQQVYTSLYAPIGAPIEQSQTAITDASC